MSVFLILKFGWTPNSKKDKNIWGLWKMEKDIDTGQIKSDAGEKKKETMLL